uniref:CID domain-containing protein n=1 Tax=Myotis lucifugus TaxID=59463 RepID=G1Q6Z7_MYOLU
CVHVEKEAPEAAGSGRRSLVRRRRCLPGSPRPAPCRPPTSLRGQHVVRPEPERGSAVPREAVVQTSCSCGPGTMSEPTLAEAGPAGAREDACREYQSSLQDLTFNSKPHINMLTRVAEQNLPFAKEIVSLIEAQIAKAPSSEKLPVLY